MAFNTNLKEYWVDRDDALFPYLSMRSLSVSGTELDLRWVPQIVRSVFDKGIAPFIGVPEVHHVRQTAASRLTPWLIDLLPDSKVVDEKAVAENDQSVLTLLSSPGPVWVINPMDSQRNFRAGSLDFTIMVALVEGGCTTAACIFHPGKDRWALAARGWGSWVNGLQIAIADQSVTLIGTTGRRQEASDQALIAGAGHLLIDMDSVGLTYLAILQGELDFSLYRNASFLEHAAGPLLVREAGGVSALLDGLEYEPKWHGCDILTARSQTVWSTLNAQSLTAPYSSG